MSSITVTSAVSRSKDHGSKLQFTLLWTALFLLSLYDFYFPQIGIAVAPLVGVVLLFALLFAFPIRSSLADNRRRNRQLLIAILMVVLFFLSAGWGFVAFRSIYVKGPIAFSLGVITLVSFLLRDQNPDFTRTLYRAVSLLLAVHLGFWVIQFGWFLITGNFIDYIQPITHVETRNMYGNESITLFRFTGLFAEPAIYSTFMYMGITIRLLHNRFKLRWLDLALLLSMVLSLSIFGILLAGAVLTIYLFGAPSRWKSWVLVLLLAGPALGFVLVIDTPISEYVRQRMFQPTQDASGKARLFTGIESFLDAPAAVQVFGKGLGNYDSISGSAIGFAYLLETLGALGSLLVIGLFTALASPQKPRFQVLLIMLVTLLGAPLFTNIYWWVWAGSLLIFGSCTVRASTQKSEASVEIKS